MSEETFRWVAPMGTADCGDKRICGRGRRPSSYSVTVAIPTLGEIEPLKRVIELLRLQTERPFIMVIDTGSPREIRDELYSMRAEDLEIHSLALHGVSHSSEPVTIALDAAQALCRTPWLFHTHADCFLRRRDLLETWGRITNANTPVVGYRMSPRDWITDQWKWMVGHTALMLWMPEIHRIGATWSFQRMHYAYGYPFQNFGGWPDTECGFNHALRDAGIKPVFTGFDRNHERHITDDLDHVRSFSSSRVYHSEHTPVARDWMTEAVKDAEARIALWESEEAVPSALPCLTGDASDSVACSASAGYYGSNQPSPHYP